MLPRYKTVLLLICGLVICDLAHGQRISLDFGDVELRVALRIFATQGGVNVVFSERQVAGMRTTCIYGGDREDEALECILKGTSLKAERVRRRQYVLTDLPNQSEPEPSAVLRGFVTDAISGELLTGANIYLPEVRLGTITNEAGYFAMTGLPPTEYTARISYVGYVAVDTILSTASRQDIQILLQPAILFESELTLEAARIKPFAVEPGLLKVPIGTFQRLPGSPGRGDLLNALRWLPGVNRAGSGASGLVVRGSAPDQNLYLLDGVPVYHPWHAFSLVSTFQSETFKNVQLYRGSFPAEYGGRLSAVLDAELKDGSRDKLTAVAGADLLSVRIFAEGPLSERVSMMASARRSYIDQIIGTVQPVSDGTTLDTLRTGYYFWDGSTKVTWRYSNRRRLSLSFYGGRDALDLHLPFDISLDVTSPNFRDWLRPADLFFKVDSYWSNYVANARYQYLYSDDLFLTASIYSSSYLARESIYIQPIVSSSVDSRYRVNLQDNGIKLDIDYYPSFTNQVRVGLRGVRRYFGSSLYATVRRTPRSEETTAQRDRLTVFEVVGYIQDTWKPSPALQVQPGLRVSSLLGNSPVSFEPRLGVRLSAGQFVLRGFSGIQVQYVHRIRDRYSFLYDLVSARWVPASGSEGPSRSYNASLGIATNVDPRVTMSVDTYWHLSRGILLPIDESRNKDGLEGPGIELGTLLGQYVRGEALSYGLECMVRVSRGPWLGWLSYSAGRSHSRTQDESDRIWRPTRYDTPQFLEAVVQRDLKNWFLAVSSTWRSGYPVTIPMARYSVGDILEEEPQRYLYRPHVNNGRLPATLRLGLQAGYTFEAAGAQFNVQAQIYNLTNRLNVVGYAFDPDVDGPVEAEKLYGFRLFPLLAVTVTL